MGRERRVTFLSQSRLYAWVMRISALFPPAALALTLAIPCASAPADPVKIEFDSIAPAIIQQRPARVTRKLADRKAALESLFQEVGCQADRIAEQPVPHSKQPNVICTMLGQTVSEIVVGRHFDSIETGMGAVDDWSGAVLLPSLYQSLDSKPRRHRFVFVGFAGEEAGLHGSGTYVNKLTSDERSNLRAMVNLECLGLSPPKVWASRADPLLLQAYAIIAGSLHLEPSFFVPTASPSARPAGTVHRIHHLERLVAFLAGHQRFAAGRDGVAEIAKLALEGFERNGHRIGRA